MKIDVEGAELHVLRGAARTIQRHRPALIFESCADSAEKLGSSHRDLFEYLTGYLKYDILHFDDFLSGRRPLDWPDFNACHKYPFRAFNFLGLPRSAL
jgi:hypothetical protein